MLNSRSLIIPLCLAFGFSASAQAQIRSASVINSCDTVRTISHSARASWYGPGFHGRRTANGEIFNMYAMTAAHKSLKLGTRVLVANLENGMQAVLRVNDRGPYIDGRVLDVSKKAADVLGFREEGVARIKLSICAG